MNPDPLYVPEDEPRGLDLTNGATVGVAWWVYPTGAVSATLAVVLLLLGIRAVRHPGGTR